MNFLKDIFKVAAPILGDLGGTAAQYHANRKLAEDQRSWQEYMSNTAMQRSAKDMEAAGLNRILAVGQPATTPSGAQASISAPTLGKTGIQAASAKQAISQSQAEERLIKQREQESQATEALAISNALTSGTQADLNKANEALARETARLRAAEATVQERYTPIHDKVGQGVESLVRILEDRFTSSAKDAKDDKAGFFARGLRKLQDVVESKMREGDEWYKKRIPIYERK